MRLFGLLVLVASILPTPVVVAAKPDPALRPYLDAIDSKGRDPVEFVASLLDERDLILFDDALHTAVEPWDFYQKLIRSPKIHDRVKYVFVEVFPLNWQYALDAYLASEPADRSLLLPALQNGITGTGLSNKIYIDFLRCVHDVNENLPKDERIRVIGVASPTYWHDIRTPEQMTQFRERALLSYDHTMYRVIVAELDRFRSGRKGLYLANTRHTYNGIKQKSGEFYWNCGTFLRQRYPGRTYSIRCHCAALFLESIRETPPDGQKTTEGLETVDYRWDRMAGGLWDAAFAANGNKPVAVPLAGTPFGAHPYVGNHMLGAAPGQTMADAHDAIVFLAPLEQWHKTATVDWIYTPEFVPELARRLPLIVGPERVEQWLREHDAATVEEVIPKVFAAEPETPLPQTQNLPPRDAWKRK